MPAVRKSGEPGGRTTGLWPSIAAGILLAWAPPVPAQPADRPAAPGPATPAPVTPARDPAAVRERVLRRVDEVLRRRRERILDEVRRVLDEELARLADPERRDAGRRRRLARAADRLDEITRRLRDLKAALEAARTRAEEAKPAPPRPAGDDDRPQADAEPAGEEPESPTDDEASPLREAMRNYTRAFSLHESGDYEKALAAFADLLDDPARPELREYRIEARYRLACCHAVLGRADPALEGLEKAIRAGFRRVDQLEEDAELDGLRDDPRFERLVLLARSQRG